MEKKIFSMARKIFGERRYEEMLGQLWLDRDRLVERVGGRSSTIPSVLREWAERYARDVEQGRFRVGRNRRHRILRFSEIRPLPHLSPEEQLDSMVREVF